MKQQEPYIAGLYMRLSKDDENAGESQSISNQRNILREYARGHQILVKNEYVDDGYSGTSFNRPDFQRMLSDIESGYINCVITKDLSRLGRNSAKTSDLLDEYFPSHNIRYIAVIEGYDTLNLTNGTIMSAPFMLLMNEMYARDISNKIRSSLKAKMERGDYIGSFAPYGYKKDVENGNKNHLVVDYNVSHIVQEMFHMAADGYSPSEIAQCFNNKSVATPLTYRTTLQPYVSYDNCGNQRKWSSSIVCKMLKNRVYLGHTQQGKTNKVSFKSKSVYVNKEQDWIEVKDTHKPIISEEIFDLARKRCVARRVSRADGFKNIFSGIAVCAHCKRNMSTVSSGKKGSSYSLSCGGYKLYGTKKCSNHFIDYDLLYKTIQEEIRLCLSLPVENKMAIVKQLKDEKSIRTDITGEIQHLEKLEQRKQEICVLVKKAYEQYCFGKIPENIYSNLMQEYSSENRCIERSIAEIKKYSDTEVMMAKVDYDVSLLDEITDVGELTVPMIKKLIDKIEVQQGYYIKNKNGKRIKCQHIKIIYRFMGDEGIILS